MSGGEKIFTCTPGGVILRSRQRLKLLLWSMTLIVLVAAVGAWLTDRAGSALVAVIVALIPWTAWRMSGDLDPLFLQLDGELLTLQLRRQRLEFPILGAGGRRLAPEEIDHLRGLATKAGFTSGSGGFDSHIMGEVELFASELINAVLVEAGESRLVLTPDDPQSFLDALLESAPDG